MSSEQNPADLMLKTWPLVDILDVRVIIHLMRVLAPKTVIEFGIGGGGWVLAINHVVPGIQFVGVDNFTFDHGFHWPKSPDDLIAHMQTIAKGVGNDLDIQVLNQNAVDVQHFPQQFDVVRLDCLDDMADVTHLIDTISPSTTDDAVFFVGNIVPRLAPGRFMAFMDKSVRGELCPVWFGHREGLWAKSPERCAALQSQFDGQAVHRERIELDGQPFDIMLSH